MKPVEQKPAWQSGQPKLLDRVRDRRRVRHLSLSTEHAYVGWIRRFILFHSKRHPLQMGAAEVSAFLTHLAVDGHMAASTQNQALSALRFLYREVLEQDFGWLDDVVRAKKPKRLPVVFSPEEALAVIGQLQGVHTPTANGVGNTCFARHSRQSPPVAASVDDTTSIRLISRKRLVPPFELGIQKHASCHTFRQHTIVLLSGYNKPKRERTS
jgi:hypothetical protein